MTQESFGRLRRGALEDARRQFLVWLPRDLRERAGQVVASPESRQSLPKCFEDQLNSDVAVWLADVECDFKRQMRDLSPESLFLASPAPATTKIRWLMDNSLMSRFAWVIAATATGEDRNNYLLALAVTNLGRWWAGRWLGNLLSARSDHSAIDVSAGGYEEIHRIGSTQVRYLWATEKICASLASYVASDTAAASRVPELTTKSVAGLCDALRSYHKIAGRNGDPEAYRQFTRSLSAEARPLALALSLRPGCMAQRSLRDLMASRDIYEKPWIEFPEIIFPVGLDVAAYDLDKSLLGLIDARGVKKGEVFEAVAEECVGEALRLRPSGRRPYRVRVDANDEGELDGALGNPVEVVLETKARITSTEPNAIAKNFIGDCSEAVVQLRRRLDALTNGSPLVDADGGSRSVMQEVAGLVVVSHAYGSAMLNPEILDLLPSTPATRYPVLINDLHGWLLVLHALGSAREWRRYLEFRRNVAERRVAAMDELDLLLLFLSGLLYEEPVPPEGFLLGGVSVAPDHTLNHPKPESAKAWRMALREQVRSTLKGPET